MINFAIAFLGVMYGAPSRILRGDGYSVASEKEQRSPELVADLKLRADVKRKDKGSKRYWDSRAVIRGQYNNHYQTN